MEKIVSGGSIQLTLISQVESNPHLRAYVHDATIRSCRLVCK